MMDGLNELIKMTKKQPLHPDLAACIIDTESGMQFIQHPLVHTFYTPGFEKILNQSYETKLAMFADYERDGHWHKIIEILVEKPHRLEALKKYGDSMPDFIYWGTVSSVWTSMEFFYDSLADWSDIFNSGRTGRDNMMDETELAELAALPDVFPVYRGGTDSGYSWTLDHDIAQWFSDRFDKGHPIHTRSINKSEVIALLNHRGEHEIIFQP